MARADSMELVPTSDGGQMPAFVARPASGAGPGVVVLQEIFGVTDYIKQRARDLADLGWPVVPSSTGGSLGRRRREHARGSAQAFGYMRRLTSRAVQDASSALSFARDLPETSGRAGVLGFCMGGRLAYQVAVAAAPDVLVSYYGSGIASQLDTAPRITAPTIFHFGEADAYLPVAEAGQIRAAFASHASTEVHMHHGAGHAFDNPSPMFNHAGAAAEAWQQTSAFLERHLLS
jgi:carboxymethylenebutenolidase